MLGPDSREDNAQFDLPLPFLTIFCILCYFYGPFCTRDMDCTPLHPGRDPSTDVSAIISLLSVSCFCFQDRGYYTLYSMKSIVVYDSGLYKLNLTRH